MKKIVSCKIGTQPTLVIIDRRQKVAVGKVIKVRDVMPGSKWYEVRVDSLGQGDYFFASKE